MHRFRTDLTNKKLPQVSVPMRERMMCLNESTLDPFQAVREAFLQRMRGVHLNRYFSEVTAQLTEWLSQYVGVPADRLVWANGADDLLFHTFLAVREDDRSFFAGFSPSYFDYKRYAGAVGLQARFVQLDDRFDFDLDEYLALATHPDCKLCVLCQPNNPTGNLMDEEKILAILRAVQVPVLVDETYFEFSGRTLLHRLDEFPHLLLVRSFSKAFSSAGLRFGYAVAQPQSIVALRKVMTFFHSSIFTQALVLTMLEHQELFLRHTRQVCALRDAMYAEMAGIPGLRVWPSHTNFLLFSVGERRPILYEHLQRHEIAVRDVSAHPLLADCLRVTVSSPRDNEAFLHQVRAFLDAERRDRT